MSIDVNNESGTEVDEQAILDIARYALARMRIHPLSELSVIVVDEDAMEQLHIQWMDLPGPTDVMSFPMDELRPPLWVPFSVPFSLSYFSYASTIRPTSLCRTTSWDDRREKCTSSRPSRMS